MQTCASRHTAPAARACKTTYQSGCERNAAPRRRRRGAARGRACRPAAAPGVSARKAAPKQLEKAPKVRGAASRARARAARRAAARSGGQSALGSSRRARLGLTIALLHRQRAPPTPPPPSARVCAAQRRRACLATPARAASRGGSRRARVCAKPSRARVARPHGRVTRGRRPAGFSSSREWRPSSTRSPPPAPHPPTEPRRASGA
jgi:hypothetical protein